MREALNYLFEELNRQDIRYCVLHGWQSLPDEVSTDLDLATHSRDIARAELVVASTPGSKLVQILPTAGSQFTLILEMTNGVGRNFVPVDVSTDLRVGICNGEGGHGRVYFRNGKLLYGRQQWNGIWTAAPDIEFSYLLIKKVVKGTVPIHQQVRLRQLRARVGIPESQRLSCGLFGTRWGSQVDTWVAEGDWATFERNVNRLRRALRWQALKQEPANPIRFWLPELVRVWKRWRYPTGLWVAVLGPDGAGKSAVIDALEGQVQGAFRRRRRFHLRPGLIPKRGGEGPETAPHKYPPYSRAVSVLKGAVLALDYLLGYWLRVRPPLVRTTLVLFDRYYDDLLVDPRRYRYGSSPRWLRLLGRLVPRPDLWVLLDAPVQTLRSRKQELDEDELQRQRAVYREVLGRFPNVTVVDASRPLEEVTREVADYVLGYLERRYRVRRRLWLGRG